MKTDWTEERIRKELRKLDERTGLHGAVLPISFTNSNCQLACFVSGIEDSFRFSNIYLKDNKFPDVEVVYLIRHEYAHYMSRTRYGAEGGGHGAYWKKCCSEIDAYSIRCHSKERAEYHQKKSEQEDIIRSSLDRYRSGSIIRHPQFGDGVINNIVGEGLNRIAKVRFASVGPKSLGLQWINSNCKLI